MGQTTTFDINSPGELHIPAKAIAQCLDRYPVVAFHGSMGAGKTTLIRAIAQVLGIKDTVTSPTFAIVNDYLAADDRNIYHFDFYRIDDTAEAFDLGYEEYFYSGNPCLVEWPGKIGQLLPPDTLSVTITAPDPSAPTARRIILEQP